MPLAIVHSRALTGVVATEVSVEVHITSGLSQVSIVGLADTEVKESRERVRAALINGRFKFPYGSRVTINLAPANLPKEGGRYDLPIALGILVASGQLPADQLDDYEFAGELSLDGHLRSCGGALPMTLSAMKDNRTFIFPIEDAQVGALAETTVLAADSLSAVCTHLTKQTLLSPAQVIHQADSKVSVGCLSEVKGQIQVKRALKIAATGGHSLLMVGPPGSGKSMLASRLIGLMPNLTKQEALESAAVRSLGNQAFNPITWRHRPYRSPHHTASATALVGGGSKPKPGEISLAHHGVLFLDELPEFDRHVLEVLREPLENGVITISRASHQAKFPAHFQLITAMNPCPCGYYGHPQKACQCTPAQINRYRSKISGPLLDRIDMHVQVSPLPASVLTAGAHDNETSQTINEMSTLTRRLQINRQQNLNARLSAAQVDRYCVLNEEALSFVKGAMQQLQLSARAYHRIIKVARTIADMAQEENITVSHLKEAIQCRRPMVIESY